MKKTLLCMALVSVSFYGSASYAAEVSPTEELVSDIVANMQNISPAEQLKRLETYENIISEISIDEDSKQVLISYINQKKTESSKKVSQNTTITTTSISNTNTQIPNANREEIVKFWLGLHNDERTDIGESLFSYDENLDMTANTWANQIKNSGKTKNFHQRKSSDGYYNYNSIKEWFANLGVNPTDGIFTENIGWGYYRCNGNDDCTESIKKAIKTTRDFFMKEKGRNGSHYKAISNGTFTKIGLGLALDPSTKKYYLVTHYTK